MNLNFAVQHLADQLHWRLAKAIRRVFPLNYGFYSVISADPIIIIIPEDYYDEPELWRPFFDALLGKKVYFLCIVLCNIEAHASEYQASIQNILASHRSRFPSHEFIFLANSSTQRELYSQIDLPSYWINHNIFVDQQVFSVEPILNKKYDAVYNAVMLPYKRHELAAGIPSLSLITYLKSNSGDYFRTIAEALHHGRWYNFAEKPLTTGDYRALPKPEVSRFLNEAKTGLCLSESEGAMYASMEYLLCGLPVVSTQSAGGRDTFFDAEYSTIVEPNPVAVNQGVQEMIKRRLSPDYVRRKVIAQVEVHRLRLIELVNTILGKHGRHIDPAEAYSCIFSQDNYRLRELHRVSKIVMDGESSGSSH